MHISTKQNPKVKQISPKKEKGEKFQNKPRKAIFVRLCSDKAPHSSVFFFFLLERVLDKKFHKS